MRALIYIMTPVLILTFLFASRFVTWEKLKGIDGEAVQHLTNGTQLLKKGKRYQAIDALTRAIEIEPKYADAYFNRGWAYYQLARYKEAIADYTRTISLKQYTADAYASRGDAYRALNNMQNAITDYTASLKRSKNASVLTKRAKGYLDTGKFNDAISDYSYVVQHRPTAIAYYNRGSAYYEMFLLSDEKQNTLKLALDDLNKSIEKQPLFAIAYLHRGDIHGQLAQQKSQEADYSQAIVLLTEAIQNWKDDAYGLIPILLWRAVAYKKNNHADKAQNDIKRVYELVAQFYLKKIKISDIL